MPPRFTYWTILLDGKSTAFRAHTPDELLPTLRQLQVRHPEAAMLWFARGRLWSSPEEERAAAQARRASRERRLPDWRPGGEHRDPRERFEISRDEKRRRFAAKARRQPRAGSTPEAAKDKEAWPSDSRRTPGRPSGRGRPRSDKPAALKPGRAPGNQQGQRDKRNAAGGRGRGPGGGGRGSAGGERGERRGGPGGWSRERGGRGRGNGGGGRGGRGGK
jgi:hypothetical protein